MWNDIRTDSTVDQILAKIPENNKNHFKGICGLPVSPYFSAFKLKWLIYYVPAVKKAIKEKKCLFGTVDTWLLWVSLKICNNDITLRQFIRFFFSEFDRRPKRRQTHNRRDKRFANIPNEYRNPVLGLPADQSV